MSDGRYARSDPALAAVATAPRADPARVPLTLALPGIGELELRETVHVLRDGDRLFGFVLADDEAGQLCLLTLGLDRDVEGWCATVERVVERRSGRYLATSEARGTTFRLVT
jgi:hypothetical protein